jgi:hypothetical protein
MASLDEILRLAREGDAYRAIESSAVLVRRLKKKGDLREAFRALMTLADVLRQVGQASPSTTAASRALTILAADRNLVNDEVRDLVLVFADGLGVDAAGPDLFNFFRLAIDLAGDPDFTLSYRWIKLAEPQDSWHEAQVAYIRLILAKVKDNIDVQMDLKNLMSLIDRWGATISDLRTCIFTAQFIVVRIPMCILGACAPETKEAAVDVAEEFLRQFYRQRGLREMPLFKFAWWLVRAVKYEAVQSFDKIVKAFRVLIHKDVEMAKWVNKIRTVHFGEATGGRPNVTAVITNVLHNLFHQVV